MVRALHLLHPAGRGRGRSDWYPWLLRHAERRHRGELNFISIFEGDPGSGKSSGTISLSVARDPLWLSDPEWAVPRLTVFSAREWNVVVGLLLNAEYLLRDLEGLEVYRGRNLVVEEAETNTIVSAGAYQEMEQNMEVFRQWQIDVHLNLPLSEDIKRLKYRLVHAVVWTYGVDRGVGAVRGLLRVRYRHESIIAFVHPRFWIALRRGVYPPQYASVLARRPGAPVLIPWSSPEVWEVYQREKRAWFRQKIAASLRRLRRLSRKGVDLGPYIARRHMLEIEELLVESVGEEVLEPLYRRAEREAEERGGDWVDVVDEVLRRLGW